MPIGLEARYVRAIREVRPFQHLAALGVDAAQFTLVAFPSAVPELSVEPGHARDEAVGLEGPQDIAVFRVDLIDFALAVVPDPERTFGPGQARVAALAGRWDGGENRTAPGIELVNLGIGDLVDVLAIERRACMAGDAEGALGPSGRGVKAQQVLTCGKPDVLSVVGDAGDLVELGKRTILT